ncbi:MAG: hypothetical protein HC811_07090 [Flammeovirgaceae bacterium]|nr:hypothetical protein [Flammeovirgaceae bacterium]
MRFIFGIIALLVLLGAGISSRGQNLYTARGYWEESTKKTYLIIKEKRDKNEVLNADEQEYIMNYEEFLTSYFQRLPDKEKELYESMKETWDKELSVIKPQQDQSDEFDFRGRDRFFNFIYGAWYGASIVIAADIDNVAAGAIPLITGGAWMLGPAINPKKFENINETTMRAANGGKFLGLGYGVGLGLVFEGGDNFDGGPTAIMSSIGSIALGEVGFQMQKRKQLTAGHIELLRHYGVLGPLVGLAGYFAINEENGRLAGASILAGGAVGLLLGNNASKKYNYTRGDVDVLSSFSIYTAGLGLTGVVAAIENSNDQNGLILIPAFTAIAGTSIGQRMVRGANLTNKQGSTIVLASGGAAAIGLGIIVLTQSDSPTLYVGIPTVLGLVTNQILFSNYKKKNIELGIQGNNMDKSKVRFSFQITPENYMVNKKINFSTYSPERVSQLHQPLFKCKLTF